MLDEAVNALMTDNLVTIERWTERNIDEVDAEEVANVIFLVRRNTDLNVLS